VSPCRLSIIVPARNEVRRLAETLTAVLAAVPAVAHHGIEVIVVDNASHDGTWELLQRFVANEGVRAYRLEALGAARARNYGRQQARGELLVFIDADTQIPRESLERILHHCLERGAEAGITGLAGLEGGLRAWLWWTFWGHVRRLPLARAKAMPACMFCTASVFDEFGPFDEQVAIAEEWPILAGLYARRPHRFVYDRTLTALSSNRRMEGQTFGYLRTFFKYVWAVLHRSGRIHFTDRIR
jgi:glycosyltransferase involved in cell wall biosynthesis